jgi:hypothetical protein
MPGSIWGKFGQRLGQLTILKKKESGAYAILSGELTIDKNWNRDGFGT